MTGRVEQEYLQYIEEKKSGAPGNTVTLNIKEVAQHFYDLALEYVKKEANRRYKDNLKAADKFAPNSHSRGLFSAAAKEDFDIVSFIDNQKAE